MGQAKNSRNIQEVLPSAFVTYREYLYQIYVGRKNRPGGYSLVRFAADLGMATATVIHQILKGKRKLTARAAQKVVRSLDIKGPERLYFLKMVDHNNAATSSEREALQSDLLDLKSRMAPTALEKDQIEFVSDWFHPVIRELMSLQGIPDDAEWIARALIPHIRADQARKSLDLLVRLGLIERDARSGRYVQKENNLNTLDGNDELAFIQYQRAMIDLGRESISTVDPDERYVTATSFRVRRDQISRLKDLVRQFNMELLALEAPAHEADEVFQLNIQLFPLTRTRAKKGASDEAA